MPRRTRTVIALAGTATAGLLVALVPGSAGAQTSTAESVENTPASCKSRPNNTLPELLECVTIAGVRSHLEAFQRIADNNDDTRVSGTSGFDRSAAYVVKKLTDAGYHPRTQRFDFPYFLQLTPPVFEQTAPTQTTFVEDTDYATMDFSGSGDVTAPITNVDLLLPPVGGSTSGCEASDFTGFPSGNVALIQRGTCDFFVKAANAEAAGASAAIIFNEGNIDPDRTELLFGTLGEPGVTIPVIGTTFALGDDLAAGSATVRIQTDTFGEIRSTTNVLADLAGKRPRVIQVGAHLDSVPEGPGIQDNGTGSAAILEVAVQMAHSTPINTVRFSWWGAEEQGLYGSTFYVDDLAANAPRELNRIKAYLNFDMIGSPNFARFVYDGDQSTFPEDLVPVPPGSAEIEAIFERFYSDRGLAFEDTAFDGRSDYQAFALAGIPAGGLFTGAEDPKSPEQAAVYGGTAGEAFDPCYHQACDTIRNVNREVLRQNSDAVAFATYKLANARDLPGEAASALATAEAASRDRTRFNPHRAAA